MGDSSLSYPFCFKNCFVTKPYIIGRIERQQIVMNMFLYSNFQPERTFIPKTMRKVINDVILGFRSIFFNYDGSVQDLVYNSRRIVHFSRLEVIVLTFVFINFST